MATSTLAGPQSGTRTSRMDERLVFAKTHEGQSEVRARGFGLSLTARRVLIMVDGTRSVAELSPLLRPGEIDGVLTQLESMRLIQRVDFDVPPQRGEIPADEPSLGGIGGIGGVVAALHPSDSVAHGVDVTPHEEPHMVTIDAAKRRAVRELNERLGPDSETMAIRIEQCRNIDELRDRLREAERLVAGFLGESAAQDFVRAMRRRYSPAT